MFFCVEGAVGRRLVQAWVNAIRLASWEKVRLEEIYTGALIRARLGAALPPGPGADPADLASAPPQPNVEEPSVKSPLIKGKMEKKEKRKGKREREILAMPSPFHFLWIFRSSDLRRPLLPKST